MWTKLDHARPMKCEARVSNSSLDPRIAALWIVHGRACADLLRAHGRGPHAANYEAAMEELAGILAREIGHARLASAIDWVVESTAPDDGAARHGAPLKH
jgi:hypothetical protein